MLRAMRGAAETWIIKLLMFFLVISFSIWGVGDIFRGNPQQRTVACVGGFYLPLSFLFGSSAAVCTGERITVQQVAQEFRRAYDLAKQKRNADFTQDVAKREGLLDRTLREIVARKLFSRAAHDYELRYDAKAVIAQLANTPDLRTQDGSFDREKFKRAMTNLHMTEAEFIAYMSDTFARDQSVGLISAISTPPKAHYNEMLRAQGQERLLQVLTIAHEKMPVPASPDAKTLETFHKNNPELFMAPERRSISVLKLMLDDLAKNTPVSDTEVAEAFAKRKEEFALPDRRDFLQVVVADADVAQALAKEAQAGKDLRKAATKAEKEAIVLEDQSEATIPAELYTTIFSADLGSISDPIKTEFGYHIVQLLQVKPAYKPVLTDVQEKLRSKLQREQAQETMHELANAVDDALGAAKGLEEIAAAHQLTVEKFSDFDNRGMNSAGNRLTFPASGIILQNAFGLGEGESSAVLDDHLGNYFVVHIDEVKPAHLRPYADVKDIVLKAWQSEQQKQAAQQEAERLMAEWQKRPQAYAEIIKRPNLSGFDDKHLSILGGYIDEIPQSMQDTLVAAKVGEIKIASESTKHYVVRISGNRAFDPKKHTEAQGNLRNIIDRGWRGDILEQYETALRSRFPVGLNETIVDELRRPESAQGE